MPRVISSVTRERAGQTENLISQAFAPVTFVPDEDAQISEGGLRYTIAADVVVSRGRSPGRVLRSRRLIGSTDRELIKVAMPLRGALGIEQDGRQCLVESDALVVYETARPYEMRLWASSDVIVFGIPRHLLGSHFGTLARWTASAICIATDDQRFAATMLRTTAEEMGLLAAGGSPHVADTLVSLVLTAVAGEQAEYPGQELTDRIMTYCLTHLSDPRLSRESVARAHRVSVRYLTRIMQPGGMTLSAWIRNRRLEQIRRDLANPAYAHRSVAQIAAEWGILDADHLSRSLRAEFGQSAAEIRRSVRERTTGRP